MVTHTAKWYRLNAAERIKPFADKFAVIYFLIFALEGILMALAGGGILNLIIEGFIYSGTFVSAASATMGVVLLCLSGPLALGMIHLQAMAYEEKEPEIKDALHGFGLFTKGLILTLWEILYIFLWSLLFFIPGIIAAYRYSLAAYLLHDHPELDPKEAIEQSKKLMHGKKWKLFCLDLSYIGWYILCGLTLRILSFWVEPKHQAARYQFYRDVIAE